MSGARVRACERVSVCERASPPAVLACSRVRVPLACVTHAPALHRATRTRATHQRQCVRALVCMCWTHLRGRGVLVKRAPSECVRVRAPLRPSRACASSSAPSECVRAPLRPPRARRACVCEHLCALRVRACAPLRPPSACSCACSCCVRGSRARVSSVRALACACARSQCSPCSSECVRV